MIDNEIISNINSECEKLFQTQKTFKRQLETKYRVIKNLYKPSELGIINEDYFLPALLDKYKRFKEFANIEIIKPNNEFNISDIINNYFEHFETKLRCNIYKEGKFSKSPYLQQS